MGRRYAGPAHGRAAPPALLHRRGGGAELQPRRGAAAHGPAAAQRGDPTARRDLGVDLFVRTTREVRLTDAGRAFLQARGGRWRMPNGRPRTPSARPPASSGICGSPIPGAPASRRSRCSAGVQGRPPGRRAPGPGDVERPDARGVRQRQHRHRPLFCPESPPSWSSPRYARSAWSRSFRRRIGWRVRRRSRCRRSPTRSSWCSRGRSHRGCTTLSWPIYRRAGFEPRVRNESFHTGWDLGVLAEIPAVAVAPQTVAGGLPTGSSRSRSASRPTRSRPAWSGAPTTLARRRGVRGGRSLGLRTRAAARRATRWTG